MEVEDDESRKRMFCPFASEVKLSDSSLFDEFELNECPGKIIKESALYRMYIDEIFSCSENIKLTPDDDNNLWVVLGQVNNFRRKIDAKLNGIK